MDEFRRWWLGEHALAVVEKQGSMLTRYIVNIRTDTDDLPGTANTPFEWDGMAESGLGVKKRLVRHLHYRLQPAHVTTSWPTSVSYPVLL